LCPAPMMMTSVSVMVLSRIIDRFFAWAGRRP
jgi:hypothetical protein